MAVELHVDLMSSVARSGMNTAPLPAVKPRCACVNDAGACRDGILAFNKQLRLLRK